MKKGILYSCLSIISTVITAQTEVWESITTNGFDDTQNYDFIIFEEFRDTLYTAAGRVGDGAAEMYKSGNGTDWEQVFYGAPVTTKGVASINSDTIDGGIMYIATGDPTQGTKVYRTNNGRDWTPISKPGFGNPALWSPTPHMVLFQGSQDTIPYLYAAGNSHGDGASSIVYRTPYNNLNVNNWDTIVDFNTRDNSVTQVTYFYKWNNKLYFGGNGDSLLYESNDGINFVANQGVATDFHPKDLLIACIIEHNGYLYAGTNNRVAGGQLHRTSDGVNWENITSMLAMAGHNKEDEELHDIDTLGGYLWVVPYTDTTITTSGIPIWRSADQEVTSFVQSNEDGFGNPLVDGENPAVYGFKGYQYFGGPNYIQGGQLWRAKFQSSSSVVPKNNCSVSLFPNPSPKGSQINLQIDCPETYQSIAILDINGRTLFEQMYAEKHYGSLQLPNLEPGSFFIILTDEKRGKYCIKFVVF